MLEPTDVLLPAMLAGFVLAVAALVFWRGQVVWRQTGKLRWWAGAPLVLLLAPYAAMYFNPHWFWTATAFIAFGTFLGAGWVWLSLKLIFKR